MALRASSTVPLMGGTTVLDCLRFATFMIFSRRIKRWTAGD